MINIKLSDLTKKYPNLKANVIGVIREDKFFIPKKTDEIKIDDKIYVIINATQMSETLEAFGHTEKVSKKIGNRFSKLFRNFFETCSKLFVFFFETFPEAL